ncbi:hypothetical protein ACIG87_30520 [Micromonospora sp. NPDC051925]|uniref:hypothetical protein n=1 Tax=Micromonospora sp. NPDC051925 TaxID=3364288 RepID=UPI0037C95175
MREIIGAALRRQRRATALAAAGGLALASLTAWADGADNWLRLLGLLPVLIFVGVALRYLRWRPSTAELRVDESARAFFAPPAGIGFVPFLVGFLVYQCVDSVRDRAGSGTWFLVLPAAGAVFAGLVAVFLWRGVPTVVLTPEGITHGRHNRPAVVPWAALDPGRPLGSPGGTGTISLPVARPELITGPRLRRRVDVIAVRELDVTPALLSGAIRYYLANPEARPTIGTPAGHARLRDALGGGS